MKKWILRCLGLMVVALTGLILWIHFFGGTFLSQKIHAKTGLQIKIDRVSTNFISSLTLYNAELNHQNLQVQAPQIHFKFWAPHITLNNPRIAYQYSKETEKKALSVPWVWIQPFGFSINQGDIKIQNTDNTSLKLSDINAEAQLSSESASLTLSSLQASQKQNQLDVQFKQNEPDQWTTRIQLKDFEFNPWMRVFNHQMPRLNNLKGAISGTINIQGHTENPFSDQTQFAFDLKSPDMRYDDTELKLQFPLQTRFSFHQNQVTIHELMAGDTFRLAGFISDPKHAPRVQGEFNLREWNHGPFKYPAMQGSVRIENNKVNVGAKFAEGNILLTGELNNREQPLRVHLNKISLAAVASLNGWKNVKGLISSQLDLKFKSQVPHLTGLFSLNNFQWGRSPKREEIRGAVSARPDVLAISTQDESLTVNASLKESQLNLNTFKIDFGNKSNFSINGIGNFTGGDIQFNIEGNNIPPDIWPPLVSRYPDINGALDFSGDIEGPAKDPEFNLDVVLKDLQFKSQGQKWNGYTKLRWNSESFDLKDIEIENEISGSLAVQKPNNNLDVSANLIFTKSSPQLFFDIFKSSISTSGEITGFADFTFQNKKLVGISSMTWDHGNVGEFVFDKATIDSKMTRERIHIRDFNLVSAEQALRASGTLIPNQQKWKTDINMQLNQWGSHRFKFDGETNLSGWFQLKKGVYFDGTVKSPFLWINQHSIENLEVKTSLSPRRHQFNIKSAKQINGHIRISYPSQKMKGKLTGRNLDVKPIFEKILGVNPDVEYPTGRGSYTLTIAGSRDNPAVKMNLKSNEIQWRSEKFESEVFADINLSSVTLKAARATLAKGGTLFGSGTIPLNSSGTIQIQGAGTNLNLQSIMNLLRWPVNWEGETNGTFTMTGPRSQPEMTITFDGIHNGFGPFEDEGKLVGSVFYKDREWDISQIRVTSGNGFAKLRNNSRLFLDRDKSGRIHVISDLRNLKSGVLTFFGQVELTGMWEGKSDIHGDTNPPKEIDVFARSLWINQFVLDGNVSHLTIRNGELNFSPIIGSGQQVSGLVQYQDYPTIKVTDFRYIKDGVEQVYLNGLVGNNKWDFDAHINGIDASVARGLFDTLIPISGPMKVKLKGAGNIDSPIINADVNWFDGKVGLLPIDQARAQLELKEGIVWIRNLDAKKKKGFNLNGSLKLGTALLPPDVIVDPDINLTLSKGDLSILESIWPDCSKAEGSFQAALRYGQKNETTFLSGYLDAEDLELRSSSYIPQMKKGQIRMSLDQNRLKIEKGYARLGKGEAVLTGHIDFKQGEPSEYNLSLKTLGRDGVSIRIPDLEIPPGPLLSRFNLLKKKLAGISRGEPRIDLSMTGSGAAPVVKGTIDLENSVFTYPPPESKANQARPNEFQKWFQEYRKKIVWDVTMNAQKRTQYENELVNAGINGSFHFKGLEADLSINGRVTSRKGSIIYAGNEFKIEDVLLEVITQEPSIENITEQETLVYLKASAEKDVFYTDYSGNSVSDTIIMEVDRALIGEIQPRFRSKNNPSLNSEKAFQLAIGIPLGQSLDDDYLLPEQSPNPTTREKEMDVFLRSSLVQLLDSSLASPLARALTRRTGLVDVIRLTYEDQDANGASTDDVTTDSENDDATDSTNEWWRRLKGTKVKLGKELSGRLFADYSFKVDEFENELDFRHEVELAYRVHQNLYLRAISELDSERTLGRSPDRRALLENRWRFGLPRKKKKNDSNSPLNTP